MEFQNKEYKEIGIYNQAQMIQFRINKLIDEVNFRWDNLLAFDELLGEENYKIVFNKLSSLLGETIPKLNKTEKEEILKIKNLIEDWINEVPIYSKSIDQINESNNLILNEERWKLLKRALFDFKIQIFELMEVHGLGNPSKEDIRGSMIN